MKKEFKRKLEELGVLYHISFSLKAVVKSSRLSDINIGVMLKESPSKKDTKALYQSLYGLLSELYPPSTLEIVFFTDAILSLQYLAIQERWIRFEKEPQFTADYEEFILKQYLDFRSVLVFLIKSQRGNMLKSKVSPNREVLFYGEMIEKENYHIVQKELEDFYTFLKLRNLLQGHAKFNQMIT